MKEINLHHAFEFATQLMTNLVFLKNHEYRCCACDYMLNENSIYVFNFEFISTKRHDKILFCYYSDNADSETNNGYFDINIKTEKGETLDLKKLVKPEQFNDNKLFQNDTESINFTDKVERFINEVDRFFESQTDILH